MPSSDEAVALARVAEAVARIVVGPDAAPAARVRRLGELVREAEDRVRVVAAREVELEVRLRGPDDLAARLDADLRLHGLSPKAVLGALLELPSGLRVEVVGLIARGEPGDAFAATVELTVVVGRVEPDGSLIARPTGLVEEVAGSDVPRSPERPVERTNKFREEPKEPPRVLPHRPTRGP